MHYIGELKPDIYRCICDTILTTEVIITDERIAHIKQRHPNDYEMYESCILDAIQNPDYILETNRKNTAFILKRVDTAGKQFELILRLRVSTDPKHFKNSVSTFLKIGEKKWEKYLRNKKILYKRG